MKKRNKIILTILIIILVSNIPPVKNAFRFIFDNEHYCYSNGDGYWRFCENYMFNRKFNFIRHLPGKELHKIHPGADTVVYRLFWRNPVAFWRWGEYVYDKRYTLPYKNRKEIETIRINPE